MFFQLLLAKIVAAQDLTNTKTIPQYFRYNTHYDLQLDFAGLPPAFTQEDFQYFEHLFTTSKQDYLVAGDDGVYRQLECTTTLFNDERTDFETFSKSSLALIKYTEK